MRYAIDREKITKELYKRDKNLSEVSREIGYDSGYLSTSCSRDKRISKIAMNYLERTYGITPDMIAPDVKIDIDTPLNMEQEPQKNTDTEVIDIMREQYVVLKNIENNQRLIGNLLMQILEELHNDKDKRRN